jgi:hypothetical protein
MQGVVATNQANLPAKAFENLVIAGHRGSMGERRAGADLKTAGFVYDDGFLPDDFPGHPEESAGILEALDVKDDGPRRLIVSEVF